MLRSSGACDTLDRDERKLSFFHMNSLSSCPHFVYELVGPRDNSIFYVGITMDLYARYRQHMHCDGINVLKDQRMQEIVLAGHLPIMHTLERVASFAEARKREDWWIMHYRFSEVKLLNIVVPPKMQFRAKPPVKVRVKPENAGRAKERTFASVIDMLVSVHETGAWPDDISLPMRRYYKRTYPEFFSTSKRSEKLRIARMQKADVLRTQKRLSRSHK